MGEILEYHDNNTPHIDKVYLLYIICTYYVHNIINLNIPK